MNDIFLFLESSNVCNYADDNTFLAFGKTFGEVASKLKNDFLILNWWFSNNFFVLNFDKCHCMTLGTPNTLLNFKGKNIAIKNSASETLLGIIIDSKLDFTEHLNAVCKKAKLKLHALNRISRFLSPEQHVLIINAYIKSLFTIARWFGWSATGGLRIKWIRFTSAPYVYHWSINWSIQIYSWSFSWNNEQSFLYHSKYL